MFVGLDLSLTATGICVRAERPGSNLVHEVSTIKADKLRGPERLAFVRDAIATCATGASGCAIEGYAFGSKFSREALGELGGIVRLMLWERRVPFIVVPPTKLKLWATGKGNSKEKGHVMVAVFKDYGVEVGDNNQADALILSEMARHFFDPRLSPTLLNAAQNKALSEVEAVIPNPLPIRRRSRAA